MTKEQACNFRDDLNKALKSLESKYNMKFNVGRITFSEESIKTKIEGIKINNNQENTDFRRITFAQNFEMCFEFYGLKKDDLGKTNSDGYTLVGIDPKKRKYPIIAEKDGKLYKLSTFKSVEEIVKI
jgi:hypothetical protein